MQAGDLDTRIDTQRGIEIGQRFIKQEQVRIAHDRAADGDPLTLAAGQFGRLALQIGFKFQHLDSKADLPLDIAACGARLAKAEAHVLFNRQMRIQRIGLEHHRDLAF